MTQTRCGGDAQRAIYSGASRSTPQCRRPALALCAASLPRPFLPHPIPPRPLASLLLSSFDSGAPTFVRALPPLVWIRVCVSRCSRRARQRQRGQRGQRGQHAAQQGRARRSARAAARGGARRRATPRHAHTPRRSLPDRPPRKHTRCTKQDAPSRGLPSGRVMMGGCGLGLLSPARVTIRPTGEPGEVARKWRRRPHRATGEPSICMLARSNLLLCYCTF